MKNQMKWMCIFISLTIGLSCCKKTNSAETPIPDTTKPVISLTDPTSNKTVNLGSTLHLQVDLSDNIELKTYKVTITKNLKGIITSDWAFTQTWTIPSGKKTFNVNHSEITVPLTVTGNQTTTGNYDMTITCTDASGNETSTAIIISLSKS